MAEPVNPSPPRVEDEADVVIVGARCAGAASALLLAEAGLRVVVFDSSPAHSEPMSTLLIQPDGVDLLEQWGLGRAVAAMECPALTRFVHHCGDVVVDGGLAPGRHALAPPRPALDDALAGAAEQAGAEIHRRTRVTGLLRQDERVAGVEVKRPDGTRARVAAELVIGADGVHSTVADAVAAESLWDDGSLSCAYYAHLPAVDTAIRLYESDQRLLTHLPTSGGNAVVAVYRPRERFAEVRQDPRGHFLAALAESDGLAHLAEREPADLPGFTGTGQQPNYLRHPVGPGWVLLGDAAHNRDSVTAWGIAQAFRQADGAAAIVANELGSPTLSGSLEEFWTAERERLAAPYRATLKLAALRVDESRQSFLRDVNASGQQDAYVHALVSGDTGDLLDGVVGARSGGQS